MPTREIEVSDEDWAFLQRMKDEYGFESVDKVISLAMDRALQREMWLEENADAIAEERSWIDENGVPKLPAEPAWTGIVSVVPGVRSGRPVIRGMRITVGDILGWLASGMSETEILSEFPELELTDIRAALAFAAEELSGGD